MASPRTFGILAIAALTATLLFMLPVGSQQGRAAQNVDAVVKNLNDQAAQGQLSPRVAQDALEKAGVTGEQQDQIMNALMAKNQAAVDAKNQADAKAKAAADAKAKAEQNPSGTAEWNLGQIYRDRDYTVTMPLENNCKVAQKVTITYPTTINLQGPQTVNIPAKKKVDVPMKLIMTQPPLPMPPYPPGINLQCYEIEGKMKLVHPELKKQWSDASGTHTYVCHKMERTYTIKAHVHAHGPPNPNPNPSPGGGGGGGKGGKGGSGRGGRPGDSSTCDIYWNHREFYPNNSQHNPEQCVNEIRDNAREYFGHLLAPFKAKDPQAWAWAPTDADIGKMSVSQLMNLKARADAQAKATQ